MLVGDWGVVAGRRQPAGFGVVTGPGKRLVTVLVTLAVPAEADAEDAAGLVADAAVSTALQVVSTVGVEGIYRSRAVWSCAVAGVSPGGSRRCRRISQPLPNCRGRWFGRR